MIIKICSSSSLIVLISLAAVYAISEFCHDSSLCFSFLFLFPSLTPLLMDLYSLCPVASTSPLPQFPLLPHLLTHLPSCIVPPYSIYLPFFDGLSGVPSVPIYPCFTPLY